MRLGKRYLLPAIVLGSIAVGPTIASATTPSISAYNEPGIYGFHSWMPSSATVDPGGAAKFSNPYVETYHGLKFTSGPATPTCTGIPKAAGEPIGAFHWEGECTFSNPGAYTFICTVHPAEMKGTITVPGTPAAVTKPATAVTQTRATLEGAVKPEGNATEYRFEYGTATVSEHTTNVLSAGAADFVSHAASAALTGLTPATVYHFQLVAIYGPGKAAVLGGEEMFTTPVAVEPEPEPEPEAPPSPAPGATSGASGTPGASSPILAPVSLPPIPIPSGSPLAGGSHALGLTSVQHGGSVHGTVGVSSAGAGGVLEVTVFAPRASLASTRRPVGVRVGRVRRSAVHAGAVSFTVPLTARGRSALHRRHRLALTVQIVLTPVTGSPVSVTRSVVLRG